MAENPPPAANDMPSMPPWGVVKRHQKSKWQGNWLGRSRIERLTGEDRGEGSQQRLALLAQGGEIPPESCGGICSTSASASVRGGTKIGGRMPSGVPHARLSILQRRQGCDIRRSSPSNLTSIRPAILHLTWLVGAAILCGLTARPMRLAINETITVRIGI